MTKALERLVRGCERAAAAQDLQVGTTMGWISCTCFSLHRGIKLPSISRFPAAGSLAWRFWCAAACLLLLEGWSRHLRVAHA